MQGRTTVRRYCAACSSRCFPASRASTSSASSIISCTTSPAGFTSWMAPDIWPAGMIPRSVWPWITAGAPLAVFPLLGVAVLDDAAVRAGERPGDHGALFGGLDDLPLVIVVAEGLLRGPDAGGPPHP